MRRRIAPVPLALVLVTVAARPGAAQSPPVYEVCATADNGARSAFVSPVLSVAPNDEYTVRADWGKMLKEQYKIFALPGNCTGWSIATSAKQARDKFIQDMDDRAVKLTELDWKPTTGTAMTNAQVASAPPPPSATPKVLPSSATWAADAEKEMSYSAQWCQMNLFRMDSREVGKLIGCDCFAKMVKNHRLAHPEEVVAELHEAPRPVPVGNLAAGVPSHLDCTECLTDAKIAAYVHATINDQYDVALKMKHVTQAKVDAIEACMLKSFGAKIRANPNLDQIRTVWDGVYIPCSTA
jgi:hypothetical protein